MKHIKAEVITIGDEILYGQITDTNTQWISAELDKLGIKISRKSSVGDSEEAITNEITQSLNYADLIILTGGLGPTKDDITKKTLANIFDDTLEIHPLALETVTSFFKIRGRELTELNRQQALLPKNATYLHNAMGTAPGMWFEYKGKVVVSLPGVPFEMKYLMEAEVLPRVKAFFQTPVITHKSLRTVGIGESDLADLISDWEDALPPHIRLAYLPNLMQVKLRLSGVGSDAAVLAKEIDAQIALVMPLIGKYVYSTTDQELEEAVAELLIKHNATVGTAESCTGGYLAHTFTMYPGSSAYYLGGVVSYANDVKMDVLHVSKETLEQYGAVSEQTAREMAEGARKELKTTFALSTTGIAGPGGGTDEKPVGTVWIACAGPNGTVAKKILTTKSRNINIQYSTKAALNMLRLIILNEI